MAPAWIKPVCILILILFALYGILIAFAGQRLFLLQDRRTLLAHIVLAWIAAFLVFQCICDPVLIQAWKDRGTTLMLVGLLWAISLVPVLFHCAALTKDQSTSSEDENGGENNE